MIVTGRNRSRGVTGGGVLVRGSALIIIIMRV